MTTMEDRLRQDPPEPTELMELREALADERRWTQQIQERHLTELLAVTSERDAEREARERVEAKLRAREQADALGWRCSHQETGADCAYVARLEQRAEKAEAEVARLRELMFECGTCGQLGIPRGELEYDEHCRDCGWCASDRCDVDGRELPE